MASSSHRPPTEAPSPGQPPAGAAQSPFYGYGSYYPYTAQYNPMHAAPRDDTLEVRVATAVATALQKTRRRNRSPSSSYYSYSSRSYSEHRSSRRGGKAKQSKRHQSRGRRDDRSRRRSSERDRKDRRRSAPSTRSRVRERNGERPKDTPRQPAKSAPSRQGAPVALKARPKTTESRAAEAKATGPPPAGPRDEATTEEEHPRADHVPEEEASQTGFTLSQGLGINPQELATCEMPEPAHPLTQDEHSNATRGLLSQDEIETILNTAWSADSHTSALYHLRQHPCYAGFLRALPGPPPDQYKDPLLAFRYHVDRHRWLAERKLELRERASHVPQELIPAYDLCLDDLLKAEKQCVANASLAMRASGYTHRAPEEYAGPMVPPGFHNAMEPTTKEDHAGSKQRKRQQRARASHGAGLHPVHHDHALRARQKRGEPTHPQTWAEQSPHGHYEYCPTEQEVWEWYGPGTEWNLNTRRTKGLIRHLNWYGRLPEDFEARLEVEPRHYRRKPREAETVKAASSKRATPADQDGAKDDQADEGSAQASSGSRQGAMEEDTPPQEDSAQGDAAMDLTPAETEQPIDPADWD